MSNYYRQCSISDVYGTAVSAAVKVSYSSIRFGLNAVKDRNRMALNSVLGFNPVLWWRAAHRAVSPRGTVWDYEISRTYLKTSKNHKVPTGIYIALSSQFRWSRRARDVSQGWPSLFLNPKPNPNPNRVCCGSPPTHTRRGGKIARALGLFLGCFGPPPDDALNPSGYPGALACAQSIVATEGPENLFIGAGHNILRGIVGAFVLVGFGEVRKAYARRSTGSATKFKSSVTTGMT